MTPAYAGPLWGTLRFRRLHVALAVTLSHPLYDYGRDRFDRVTDRHIREQLVPTLPADQRPTAVELKNKAWHVAAPLIQVDEVEREYIDRVHIGELQPELLFPDDTALTKQLQRHPALLWKIENVKRHRSG